MLKGYSKYSSCVQKNIQYNGQFSEAEFDKLDQKKRDVQSRARDKRAEVSRLTTTAAIAYTALAEAQQEKAELQEWVNKYAKAQSRMLRQELTALDKLEKAQPTDLLVAVLTDRDLI